jgi:hypothetical protein
LDSKGKVFQYIYGIDVSTYLSANFYYVIHSLVSHNPLYHSSETTDLPAVDSKEARLVLQDSTEQKNFHAEVHPIDSILNSQDTADTVEAATDIVMCKTDIGVVFERHMGLREEEEEEGDPAKGYFSLQADTVPILLAEASISFSTAIVKVISTVVSSVEEET